MQIDLGVIGAKRTSFNEYNLRDLLLTVQARNPDATAESLRELLEEEVLAPGNEGYVQTCIKHAVANTVRAMRPRRSAGIESPTADTESPAGTESAEAAVAEQETAAAFAETVAAVKSTIVSKIKVSLLALIMPNGLALRDCTGADCRQFEGWAARVADQVGDRNKVGDVLDDEQLAKLYQG